MTDQATHELTPRIRRRVIIAAMGRALFTTTVLLALYYLLPLDHTWNAATAGGLLLGLMIFAVVTVWQVRRIVDSRYPAIRAFEALALVIPFYLLLFAATSFLMEHSAPASFTQPLTRTDALYFSVTVFATVGFGDIAPKSETARIVLIIQMLGDLVILGAGARILFSAVQRGQQRQHGVGGEGGAPGP